MGNRDPGISILKLTKYFLRLRLILIQKNCKALRNRISVQIEGPTWETIKGISVDKEGHQLFALLPKISNVAHIFVSQVSLRDKVKIVTLRSPNAVANNSLVALEVMIVNEERTRVGDTKVIGMLAIYNESCLLKAPGCHLPVPLGASYFNFVCIRPDGMEAAMYILPTRFWL